jgi:hypothetical protein
MSQKAMPSTQQRRRIVPVSVQDDVPATLVQPAFAATGALSTASVTPEAALARFAGSTKGEGRVNLLTYLADRFSADHGAKGKRKAHSNDMDMSKSRMALRILAAESEHTTAELFEVVFFGFLGIKPREGQDLQRLWSNHEKPLPGEDFHPSESGSNSDSDAESIEEPTSVHDVPDVPVVANTKTLSTISRQKKPKQARVTISPSRGPDSKSAKNKQMVLDLIVLCLYSSLVLPRLVCFYSCTLSPFKS